MPKLHTLLQNGPYDSMTKLSRLLIIGGTGRDAGKSSLASLLLSKYSDRGVVGVKITPHPHPDKSGLTFLSGNGNFHVYEEHNVTTNKDTSRMLKAGALKVYLIVSEEPALSAAFTALLTHLPSEAPIICESPALRRIIEPGLFIIMLHDEGTNPERKNIDDLRPLADLTLTLKDLNQGKADIIDLDADITWYLK